MNINETLAKYPFSQENAVRILETALQTATVVGLENTRVTLELIGMGDPNRSPKLAEELSAYDRICQAVTKHPWTLNEVADVVEALTKVVDDHTYHGLMRMITALTTDDDQDPPSEGLRPCLVHNHKYWFHRWQTRRWIAEPSAQIGGAPGGQCSVTMAIVEEQETGQIQEVYPRDVRFIDSRV